MKIATNKSNKTLSFPALCISFGPKVTKQVSDEIAAQLSGNSFIAIESARSQPAPKVAAVVHKVDTVKDEESTSSAKRSKHIIRDNESDE